MPLKSDHNGVARYIISRYFEGDLGKAAQSTGFSKQQIESWNSGRIKPQLKILDRLIHEAVVPEFRIIFEYKEFDFRNVNDIHVQLKKVFKGHEFASGIYAFYDSISNLVYVGKSDNDLLTECKQQLKLPLKGKLLPSGSSQPSRKADVVKYISAYSVKSSSVADHSKHVESLILRLSKPRLNMNIGKLEKAPK